MMPKRRCIVPQRRLENFLLGRRHFHTNRLDRHVAGSQLTTYLCMSKTKNIFYSYFLQLYTLSSCAQLPECPDCVVTQTATVCFAIQKVSRTLSTFTLSWDGLSCFPGVQIASKVVFTAVQVSPHSAGRLDRMHGCLKFLFVCLYIQSEQGVFDNTGAIFIFICNCIFR